jgi:hypothetical protein
LKGFLYIGAEGRARTADPILFRDMLYQLSYLGILGYPDYKTKDTKITTGILQGLQIEVTSRNFSRDQRSQQHLLFVQAAQNLHREYYTP